LTRYKRRTTTLTQGEIKQWCDQLLEGATGVFVDAAKAEPERAIDLKTLHEKIVELALENDFFVQRARQGGVLSEETGLSRAGRAHKVAY
jgi:hypothetical protein